MQKLYITQRKTEVKERRIFPRVKASLQVLLLASDGDITAIRTKCIQSLVLLAATNSCVTDSS